MIRQVIKIDEDKCTGCGICADACQEGAIGIVDGKAKLCMCYADGVPLSGALCIEYAGTMSYVYGCSSNEMRNYMPNYLMQWTMIKKAIEDGCDIYDFCGIPYWYDTEHKNFGVYKFKQGFNGQVQGLGR